MRRNPTFVAGERVERAAIRAYLHRRLGLPGQWTRYELQRLLVWLRTRSVRMRQGVTK